MPVTRSVVSFSVTVTLKLSASSEEPFFGRTVICVEPVAMPVTRPPEISPFPTVAISGSALSQTRSVVQ